MEKDALSAGVNPIGGLFSVAEIRILICYILSAISDPIPSQQLAETLHHEEIANYFEVIDSISALEESGHIKCTNQAEKLYTLLPLGKEVASTLKTSLPIVVKERAHTATLKMVSRYKNAKETDIKITREGDRSFITCSALDGTDVFMSVKLMVADEEQANFIKNKFIDDPAKIYSSIIALLTKK